LIPPITRNEKGIRIFNEEELFWLDMVVCLKQSNLSTHDIKRIVSLSAIGKETIEERKSILVNHHKVILQQIADLENSLIKVDKKIAYYDGETEC
ncbi:MAG: MerR family transcriptional regulator, partial [Bacilli bacterium]